MKHMSKKDFWIRFGLSVAITLVMVAAFFLSGGLEFFRHKTYDNFDLPFEVNYIDVGQGDSSLIRFPDNKLMLIDAGTPECEKNLVSYISTFMKSAKIDAIDFFVVTHPHDDHCGSAPAIFENFEVKNFYRPKCNSIYEIETLQIENEYNSSTLSVYGETIKLAYQEDCIMEYSSANIKIEGENYEIKFLSPIEDNYVEPNNYSPIIKISVFGRGFLFTGDAETKVENEVLSVSAADLKADILKVGHHGSTTSSSVKFLNAVSPSYGIISVGENHYNLPNKSILSRYEELGIITMQTWIEGTIKIYVDIDGTIVFADGKSIPLSNFAIILTVYILAIFMVWGVKFSKKTTKRDKK